MRIWKWTGHQSGNEPTPLILKLFRPDDDLSVPAVHSIGKYCEQELGWSKKRSRPNIIIPSFGNYRRRDGKKDSHADRNLWSFGAGGVSAESIATHFCMDQIGWTKIKGMFEAYCQCLQDYGFQNVIGIFCDIEGGMITPGGKLEHLDEPVIEHNDVLRIMYAGDQGWKPRVNAEMLTEIDPYSTLPTMQNMMNFKSAMYHRRAFRFDEVFGKVARETWGANTIVNNYDNSDYLAAPMMSLTSGLPRASCGIHGHSAPVLYYDDDYRFTLDRSLVALDAVCPGRSITPWILGPWREGTSKHTKASDPQLSSENQVEAIKARGDIENLILF